MRHALKRKRPQYYDKQQQLELALAAQELFEFGEHDLISIDSDEEEKCWTDTRDSDIWKDVTCVKLLQERTVPETVDPEECKKARKRILNCHGRINHFISKGCLCQDQKTSWDW